MVIVNALAVHLIIYTKIRIVGREAQFYNLVKIVNDIVDLCVVKTNVAICLILAGFVLYNGQNPCYWMLFVA